MATAAGNGIFEWQIIRAPHFVRLIDARDEIKEETGARGRKASRMYFGQINNNNKLRSARNVFKKFGKPFYFINIFKI